NAAPLHLDDPRTDIGPQDRSDGRLGPSGCDMVAPVRLVALAARPFKPPGLAPPLPALADGDPAGAGVDPVAAADVGLQFGGPPLDRAFELACLGDPPAVR